jgi:hypothetical protein
MDDGRIIKELTTILEELEKYYRNLFIAKIYYENDDLIMLFQTYVEHVEAPALCPTESNALKVNKTVKKQLKFYIT